MWRWAESCYKCDMSQVQGTAFSRIPILGEQKRVELVCCILWTFRLVVFPFVLSFIVEEKMEMQHWTKTICCLNPWAATKASNCFFRHRKHQPVQQVLFIQSKFVLSHLMQVFEGPNHRCKASVTPACRDPRWAILLASLLLLVRHLLLLAMHLFLVASCF